MKLHSDIVPGREFAAARMKKMAASETRLQRMLQRAVQTVDWTYSLFWQLCPQERVLVWRDGYYNGAIKTRKTMLASESCPEEEEEEAALQRSLQLRQLYYTLSAGEAANQQQQARVASAALCPEDLTESEWFYLLCISFSFPPGLGLPGRAYEQRQHIWLTGANEVDTKAFARAILAKSARIQTVLCIPLLDGVVELGTVDRVGEDIGLVQEIISIFSTANVDDEQLLLQQVPKPALSEHSSTSINYTNKMNFLPTIKNGLSIDVDEDGNDDEEDDNDNSEGLAQGFDRDNINSISADMEVESDKLIQVGSPEYSSSHLSMVRAQPLMKTSEEEDRFSQTVSTVLQHQYSSIGAPYGNLSSANSAFNKWWSTSSHHHHRGSTPSQRALKYILFTVPALHNSDSVSWKPSQQELTSTNHVQAERRRREKLNERFITLRSLVPFVTRMDKASILGDTIEYVKQLQEKIQELDARKEQMNTTGELRNTRVLEGTSGEQKIQVEVSIIEGDGLVELRCPHREGVLLEVMQRLRELRVETMMVQSTISHGIFGAELRAKVKENSNGKRATISEVKRAIHQIIPVARCRGT